VRLELHGVLRGFEVEPILGRHGEPPKNVTAAFAGALKSTAPLCFDTENNIQRRQRG